MTTVTLPHDHNTRTTQTMVRRELLEYTQLPHYDNERQETPH